MPAEIGRQMLGVMDETGTLEYGEVFVQYSPVIAAPGVNSFKNYLQRLLAMSNALFSVFEYFKTRLSLRFRI